MEHPFAKYEMTLSPGDHGSWILKVRGKPHSGASTDERALSIIKDHMWEVKKRMAEGTAKPVPSKPI